MVTAGAPRAGQQSELVPNTVGLGRDEDRDGLSCTIHNPKNIRLALYALTMGPNLKKNRTFRM
jgi:hypothetical protein